MRDQMVEERLQKLRDDVADQGLPPGHRNVALPDALSKDAPGDPHRVSKTGPRAVDELFELLPAAMAVRLKEMGVHDLGVM